METKQGLSMVMSVRVPGMDCYFFYRLGNWTNA